MIASIPILLLHIFLLPLLLYLCARTPARAKSTASTSPVGSSGVHSGSTRMGSEKEQDDKGNGEKKDDLAPIVIEVGVPAVDILLGSEDAVITEEYLRSLLMVEDKVMQYMWGMKKRMAADEASWKELSRKIGKLLAEGFTVKAGSEEAKKMRQQEVVNRVEQHLQQQKKTRKEGRKAEE